MHPYIAQIDEVAQGSSRGFFRRWWDTHRVMLKAAMVGYLAGLALMSEGFGLVGPIVLALSIVGLVVPAVHFLSTLPAHLVLLLDPTDHQEIARNTFYHHAVVWCEHDPSLKEVFAHFKHVFDTADGKTRRDLVALILNWQAPQGMDDVQLSHEEAKRRCDEMFPSMVSVEMEPSAWQTFSKKYLRI
jgi:hypothetical protein